MSGKAIDRTLLVRAWVHSHEDDTETAAVYRPAEFPFPPARGRTGFQLHPDGTLTARKPGPTDRSVVAAGTWQLAGDRLELTRSNAGTQILCIESVGPDRLVVAKRSS
jgi:hypothetical protein